MMNWRYIWITEVFDISILEFYKFRANEGLAEGKTGTGGLYVDRNPKVGDLIILVD